MMYHKINNYTSNLDILLFFFFLFVFVVLGIVYPSYSTDSWGYYELSNSIKNGSYNTNVVRQYNIETELSNSFPFFYPLLLFAFSFLGLGVYLGTVINFVVVAISLWLIVNFILDRKYIGFITLVLVVNYDFLYEIISARTIPIALFLTVCLYISLKKEKYSLSLLLMGLSCLNRFDAYPFSFLLLLAILFYFKNYNFKLYIPFFLLASIWPVYSIINFGQVFSTENSIVLSQKLPVTDVLYWNAPVIDSFSVTLSIVLDRVLGYAIFLFMPIVFFISFIRHEKGEVLSIIFCLCLYVSLLFVMLTGYKDLRYITIYTLFVMIHICNFHLKKGVFIKVARYALYLSSALLIALSSARFYVNHDTHKYEYVAKLQKCLSNDDILLVISDNHSLSRVVSTKVSVLSGVKSVMQPTNLNNDNVNEFIDMYNINKFYFLDYSGNIKDDINGFKQSHCMSSMYEKFGN